MMVIQPFTVSRLVAAPRELVFAVHTEPAHLARWMGPRGTQLGDVTLDLRVGGVYHYGLRTEDGHEMWGRQTFREIDPPAKLVFLQSFSDVQGGVARHPAAPNWPLAMLATTTFEPEGRATRLTIRWAPHEASDAEIALFNSAHDGMKVGFQGTLDQLEAYLATL